MSGPDVYTMQCAACKKGYFTWTSWDEEEGHEGDPCNHCGITLKEACKQELQTRDRQLLWEYDEWLVGKYAPDKWEEMGKAFGSEDIDLFLAQRKEKKE